jgi:hypothetical protein
MPRKIKQKQKQSQRQSVVVNIHEKKEKKVKKRRPHRKKEPLESTQLPPPVVLGLPKIPPIVVQYSEPASLMPTPSQPPAQPPVQQPVVNRPEIFNEQPQRNQLRVGALIEHGFKKEESHIVSPPVSPISMRSSKFVSEHEGSMRSSKIGEPATSAFVPINSSSIFTPIPASFQQLVSEGPPSQAVTKSSEVSVSKSEPNLVSSSSSGVVEFPIAAAQAEKASRKVRGPYKPRQQLNKSMMTDLILNHTEQYSKTKLKKMNRKEIQNIFDQVVP